MFVLFSSAAGVFGSSGPGQLCGGERVPGCARPRHASQGLAGVSMAWGLWEQAGGMTEGLGETDRGADGALWVSRALLEEGLSCSMAPRRSASRSLVPVRLDMGTLRAQRAGGPAAGAAAAGWCAAPAPPAGGAGGSLARRLAGVPEAEREGVVLEFVRSQAAAVLGHDSLGRSTRSARSKSWVRLAGAVELRNRLNGLTGLRLPATLVVRLPDLRGARRISAGCRSAGAQRRASAVASARRRDVDGMSRWRLWG